MSPMPGRSRERSTASMACRRGELVAAQDDVGVLRSDVLGDVVDVRRVGGVAHVVRDEAAGLVDEVDAKERTESRAEGEVGQRGQRAGVQAAGQQRAQRHVGDELAFDDVVEQLAYVPDGGGHVVGVLLRGQAPVGAVGDAVAGDAHGVAGLDLVHAAEDRVAGRLGDGQQLGQPVVVDPGGEQRVGQDRLGLGAEQHTVRGGRVVERLDPHPVAGQAAALRSAGPRSRSANMPLRRSARSEPHSRYAWRTTSVSLRVRKRWPCASSSRRSSRKLYASPL